MAEDETVEDLVDRKYFVLTEQQWDAFWEMLESAIEKDYTRLRQLMAQKPIWEDECPPSTTV